MATRENKKEMKSVIVIGVERARPHILIEEWRNDDVVQPPIKAQMLDITMGEDPQAPIILPQAHLMHLHIQVIKQTRSRGLLQHIWRPFRDEETLDLVVPHPDIAQVVGAGVPVDLLDEVGGMLWRIR